MRLFPLRDHQQVKKQFQNLEEFLQYHLLDHNHHQQQARVKTTLLGFSIVSTRFLTSDIAVT